MKSEKKSVAMILTHDAIYPNLDVRVIKEARSLVKHGLKVTIVCRMDKPNKKNFEQFEGINIVRVLCPHPDLKASRVKRLVYNFRNVGKVYKRLQELKPDVIHCHDLNTLLDGVLAAGRLKIPVVYDAHEDWVLLEYTHYNYSKFIYLITRLYQQILLTKVSYEIVSVAHQQRMLPASKSILLLNLPEKKFFLKADPGPIKKKYDLKDKIIVIYTGGIHEKKGIVEMIGACEKLVTKYDNLKFIAIGHNYEPYVKIVQDKSLDNYFVFTGTVHHSEIPSYLKASDICWIVHRLTKQYVIGTPTKMYEGMLAGLPILGNAEFPGMKQVILAYKLGVIVNCDVDDIVKGLEIMIKNPRKRKQMGRNAKKAAEKKYNWEVQEQELFRVYDDLLKRGKGIS